MKTQKENIYICILNRAWANSFDYMTVKRLVQVIANCNDGGRTRSPSAKGKPNALT